MHDKITAVKTYGIEESDIEGVMKALKNHDDMHHQCVDIVFTGPMNATVHCYWHKPVRITGDGTTYYMVFYAGVWSVTGPKPGFTL